MFYERLFTLDPSLRALFKGDMAEQGRKLMSLIGTAVANCISWKPLFLPSRTLGVDTPVMALPGRITRWLRLPCWTLERGLGAAFTAETRDAWVECYTTLASTMQEAAEAA